MDSGVERHIQLCIQLALSQLPPDTLPFSRTKNRIYFTVYKRASLWGIRFIEYLQVFDRFFSDTLTFSPSQ
jgi:hypothetical protein